MAVSLINKMLKDLETRQAGAPARADARPIFHDLQPVSPARRRLRSLLPALLVTAGLAGAATVGWNYWSHEPSARDAAHPPTAAAPGMPVAAPTAAVSAPLSTEPQVSVLASPPAPKPPAVTAKAAAASPARPTSAKPAPVQKPRDDRPRVASSAPDKPIAAASIEKTDRPYTPEELAENAYRDAARLVSENNAPEAERRLKALLASQPRHVKARELLVGLQLESGRWLEAQDSLEQGLTQMPEHNAFRYQLARLYLEHGAEAQSLALLERARTEGRSDAELHAFLAALYQRAGRHADAVKSYQDALALRPAEGKWWLGLGISLEAQQSNAAARDAYKRALESGRLVANLASYAEDRLKALTTR
mgnify:CR=1 FL=1